METGRWQMADIQKTRNQYVMVSPWEPFNLTEKSGYRNNNNQDPDKPCHDPQNDEPDHEEKQE